MYKLALATFAAVSTDATSVNVDLKQQLNTNLAQSEAEFVNGPYKNEVTLYRHYDYKGEQITFSGGHPFFVNAVHENFTWANHLSSFKVGPGIRATFCKHTNCADEDKFGNSFEVFGPFENNVSPDWNDKVTHVKLDHYEGGGVTVFQHYGCKGSSHVFFGGNHDFNEFTKVFGNDHASAIMVDEGVTAEIYQHGGFGGWKKVIKGPAKICNFGAEWSDVSANDQISSIKVIEHESFKKMDGVSINIDLKQLSYE
jgi:hypothetical protein